MWCKAMQTQNVYIESQIEYLRMRITMSPFDAKLKEDLLCRLTLLDRAPVANLCRTSTKPLTNTNLRYILCFLINMDVQNTATLFCVDTSTIYSVRYRLRKLFKHNGILPF